jgi:hypothetical protein
MEIHLNSTIHLRGVVINCLIKEENVEHTLLFWFARFLTALMYCAGTEVAYE